MLIVGGSPYNDVGLPFETLKVSTNSEKNLIIAIYRYVEVVVADVPVRW